MEKIFRDKNFKLKSLLKIFVAIGLFYIISIIPIFYIIFNSKFNIILYDIINIETNIYYLIMIIQNIIMILIPFVIWKFFEKKTFTQMGLKSIKFCIKDLIVGLLLGSISMIIVFIGIILIGNGKLAYSLLNPNFCIELFSNLILFILVGFAEEFFNRAYIMSTLKQTKNIYIIVIVSATIFSLMHSGNPNINLIAYINIFLVGLLFSYMYISFGNIWMCIGYHITWNYFQGNIFGFQVSGISQKGLYQTNILSENILNGGQFGPEGGLIVTIVIILGALFIKFWSSFHSNNIFEF